MSDGSMVGKYLRRLIALLAITLLALLTLDAEPAFAKKLTKSQKAAGVACTQNYNSCEKMCKNLPSYAQGGCGSKCVNKYDLCLHDAGITLETSPSTGPTTSGTYEQAPGISPQPGAAGAAGGYQVRGAVAPPKN